MVKICEVVNGCEDCPKYGDDCDGDKMTEHTDLISRADAIDAVVSWTVEDRPHEVMPTDLVDRINALPSAEAVQGEWIEKGGELVCSVCGNSVSFSRTPKGWVLGRFCQTCGAKMKGGAE